MQDRFLCVMAGYDDASEACLSAIQNKLYEAGFTGTHTKDIPQHITLGTFTPEEEECAVSLIRSIAKDTEPFAVNLGHVGLFAGSRVLFIAPDCCTELLDMRKRFGPTPGWVPHTTMLIDTPETVLRAMPAVMSAFEPSCAMVTSLHLYEFWPTRHILTVPLGMPQPYDI